MEQIVVTDVNPEDVDVLWPKVRDMLAAALDTGQGEYNLDDVFNRLLQGNMRLWIAYTPAGELMAAAVCQLNIYPQKTICYIVLTGGDIIEYWSYSLSAIEEWAYENGADAIAAYGRKGFARLLVPQGFGEVYTVVQKELSDRRLH